MAPKPATWTRRWRDCARAIAANRDGHAQCGIAGGAERIRRAQRTRHGYGVDVRAAPAGIRTQSARATPAGMVGAGAGVLPDQSILLAGEGVVAKWVAHGIAGAYKESHYRALYFHKSGAEVDASSSNTSTRLRKAVEAARRKASHVSRAGRMERLDAHACRAIAERSGGAPVFTSEDYDMYQLVSILRARPSDDLVALSRHRHDDAGAGALGRRRPWTSAFAT